MENRDKAKDEKGTAATLTSRCMQFGKTSEHFAEKPRHRNLSWRSEKTLDRATPSTRLFERIA